MREAVTEDPKCVIQEGARKTARMHGTPIYIWKDGKVVVQKPLIATGVRRLLRADTPVGGHFDVSRIFKTWKFS